MPPINLSTSSDSSAGDTPIEWSIHLRDAHHARLQHLAESINDTARRARVALSLMLILAIYIGYMVDSVRDEDLLANKFIEWPQLGIEFSAVQTYAIAPAILLYLHAQLLFILSVLARERRRYEFLTAKGSLPQREYGDWLSAFSVVQSAVSGSNAQRALPRTLAWLGVEFVPLALLLIVCVSFVRYQSSLITGIHYAVFVVDLMLVMCINWRIIDWRIADWGIWIIVRCRCDYTKHPKVLERLKAMRRYRRCGQWCRQSQGDRRRRTLLVGSRFCLVMRALYKFLTACMWRIIIWVWRAIIFIYVLIFPVYAYTSLFDWESEDEKRETVADRETLRDVRASGSQRPGADRLLKCSRQRSLVRRYLHLGERPKIEKINLSGKKLRRIVMEGVRLEGIVELRNAELSEACLAEAKLVGRVDFEGAQLKGANLYGVSLREDKGESGEVIFVRARLSEANIGFARLRGADFTDSEAKGAKFVDAILQGAIFRGAELRDADFSRANLQDADFRSSKAERAEFFGADLRGATFFGAELRDADFAAADLTGARLRLANLVEADLTGARLRNADLTGAQLQEVHLGGAQLQGAILGRGRLRCPNVDDAQICGGDFGVGLQCVDLFGVRLEGRDLRWTDLKWADLRGADLGEADLRWADLREANLTAADLRGADLGGTQLRNADLRGAWLQEVHLGGAQLQGAILGGARLQCPSVDDAQICGGGANCGAR